MIWIVFVNFKQHFFPFTPVLGFGSVTFKGSSAAPQSKGATDKTSDVLYGKQSSSSIPMKTQAQGES